MILHNENAEVYSPDGKEIPEAVSRTTHMGIAAHQDDLEIMAAHGIIECFGRSDRWFAGVVVTDGAGSPRSGLYSEYTDEQMRAIRRVEQKKAAFVGEYGVQFLLDYPSSSVKDAANDAVVGDLQQILLAARPSVVYIHNLADKHETHVGTAIKAVKALRALPDSARPDKVYGCEAWRGLDWLNDDEKVLLDVSSQENIGEAVLAVFDSQVSGGKRYDLAAMARRRANATFLASHETDVFRGLIYAMDLTPLIDDPDTDIQGYINGFVQRMADDITARLSRML